MQPEDGNGPLADRQRGLELVKGWTVAAAVGALGLTGVLGLAAADTFHGRTISQSSASASASATDSATSQDSSSSQSTPGDLTPQAPSQQAFGGGSQPPAVVSGGS
jgi:hypothetical protein